MTKKTSLPDFEYARQLLNELWQAVIQEKDGEIDKDIEKLVNSRFVSIRFCLPTQLLGKLVDSKLDCLCLQKGKNNINSQWDPRSFSSKIIVPWVLENQSVLGASTDPYVSKPLRKASIEANPGNVKGKDEWILLYQVLNEVESRNSKEYTRLCMIHTLRSIYKKLSELVFEYSLPERISIEQTERLVSIFLSEASGGDRGLSIVAALFQTFGKYFKLYKEVKRYMINASDQSTGLSGDIECIDEDGELKLAVEVKERNITLIDVKSAVQKARKVSLPELLLNSPGINPAEQEEIDRLIAKTWASGTNIYHLSIIEMVRVGLSLTGEPGKRDFLTNIGRQLDAYNTQPSNRKRWQELLEEI